MFDASEDHFMCPINFYNSLAQDVPPSAPQPGNDPEKLWAAQLLHMPKLAWNLSGPGEFTDWWVRNIFMFPYIGNNHPYLLTID